jgi:Fe-S-cluster-containing hydrogenase component 2
MYVCMYVCMYAYVYVQGPPKVTTVFQTSVLIRRSKFYRKCKVEMKEHKSEIVHKLCPENHLR